MTSSNGRSRRVHANYLKSWSTNKTGPTNSWILYKSRITIAIAADEEDIIIISCCLPPYHLQSCMSKLSTFSRHKSHPPETHETH